MFTLKTEKIIYVRFLFCRNFFHGVEYVHGKDNVVPDSLSRLEIAETTELPTVRQWALDQAADLQLQRIIANSLTTSLRLQPRDSPDGVLYSDFSMGSFSTKSGIGLSSIRNLESVKSSEQPTSQVINDINDEQPTVIDEPQSEISTVENEIVTVAEKSNITRPRKSANKRCYSQIGQIKNSTNKLQAISNSCKEDDDEFDLFAKSIAVQLKKMPHNRAFVYQEKLMDVMKQEHLFSEQSISSSWSHMPDNENKLQAVTSADI
ncbi:hypothetical protein QTP88_006753 [Uroleucon formosanum]